MHYHKSPSHPRCLPLPPPPLHPSPPAAAARCIDSYVALRVKAAEAPASAAAPVDPRLLAIIERLFERCYADGQFEQAVGVALESRRLDQLERAITTSHGGCAGGG